MTNISLFFVDYKKKLYSFQEDAEQLEGFQTQEMAKIKHLVRFIEINPIFNFKRHMHLHRFLNYLYQRFSFFYKSI